MLKLTPEQSEIHARALEICSGYLKKEFEILAVLGEVDRTKLFKKLDCPSLFRYAVDLLGLSEAMAYALISISRKSREVPGLVDRKLSIAKLSRIVAAVTAENKDELLNFAKTHTAREIDREVARRNPRAASRDRVRNLSAELLELRIAVSQEFMKKLMRAQNLAGAKELGPVLEAALDKYLFHKDPVKKAERARKSESQKPPNSVRTESRGRIPLSAAEKHAVFLRDGGRCTHQGPDGKRCGIEKWVEIHHIRPVSLGGGNDPSNLTTLCSFHHDLAHQMSLPIDGQITWLRAPSMRYG